MGKDRMEIEVTGPSSEPQLERSKSSGHLRTIRKQSDEVQLGSHSLSEKIRDEHIEKPIAINIGLSPQQSNQNGQNSNSRNALATPDVVHVFKVLSYHGLFPTKQVNDAQQL